MVLDERDRCVFLPNQTLEINASVYLIGTLGAIMKAGFDSNDISTIDSYLALEVEVMPELAE